MLDCIFAQCQPNVLPHPLSAISWCPRAFIFPGRICFLDLGVVLPWPITHAKGHPGAARACWMLLLHAGTGLCPLCPGSTSPLTSWKDSTFLWKNFTPLCINLGRTISFVTGKLKANVPFKLVPVIDTQSRYGLLLLAITSRGLLSGS